MTANNEHRYTPTRPIAADDDDGDAANVEPDVAGGLELSPSSGCVGGKRVDSVAAPAASVIESAASPTLARSSSAASNNSGSGSSSDEHLLGCCTLADQQRRAASDCIGHKHDGLRARPTQWSRAPLGAANCQVASVATAATGLPRTRKQQQQQRVGARSLLLAAVTMCLAAATLAHGAFWTFYFPNFLKASGYKEVTKMIDNLDKELNRTKDNFADIQYFWKLMKQLDDIDPATMYPEDSACTDVFPLFRELALEYTNIDYEHFTKPMEMYREHLVDFRAKWYPEGEKGKTILPREWEQKLYERELELKIEWHSKLTTDESYKSKRDQMVQIWNNVKRSLDSSLPCLYLRYAYRQMAEDINQLALEMNLHGINHAMTMLRAAYARIAKFKSSDQAAIDAIAEAIKKEERMRLKTRR